MTTTKTAVLYARISISSDESVSVARQLESGRLYATARGWEIVGEYVDDGVSASRNKPEQREAWSALAGSETAFDFVVIWKVDRLARRVIDFLHADETLQLRGAALVAVEDPIDMSSAQGRAFAQMLAVFAEMEAAAISSRIVAARVHLIANGRVPSGRPPYGWRSVPNPDGPGYVLAKDPERIEWIRKMAQRALRGDTVDSIVRWLDASGAPFPRSSHRRSSDWRYSTVHNLLSNPLLAGMIPFGGSPRQREVFRDASGRPLVRKDLAVISVAKYETILRLLRERWEVRAAFNAQVATTSELFSGLTWCGSCDPSRPMRRGWNNRAAVMRCPGCDQIIQTRALTDHVERRLVRERGTMPIWRQETTGPPVPAGMSVEDIWRRCTDDEQRHEVLAGQLDRLLIYRGGQTGHLIDPGRIELRWRSSYDRPQVPAGVADNPPAELPSEAADRWIPYARAALLGGCTYQAIRNAARAGEIETRGRHGGRPVVSKASVIAFAERRVAVGPDPWISMRLATTWTGCTEHTLTQAIRAGVIEQRKVADRLPSLSRQSVLDFASAQPDTVGVSRF